ncbi:hypothetical protein B0T21DRAFT_353866 [Apiosordaria backusii]|uniref:Zn(2)-C6 fungal-type domain-containing protein n=1 Tax=Apiosordaria backusii TaxID=314023 RepID=A0AA39ZP84_9PEZI|nr:hypothetical protein B0T21DRAFT_353866 [Apiosordaria backusii]
MSEQSAILQHPTVGPITTENNSPRASKRRPTSRLRMQLLLSTVRLHGQRTKSGHKRERWCITHQSKVRRISLTRGVGQGYGGLGPLHEGSEIEKALPRLLPESFNNNFAGHSPISDVMSNYLVGISGPAPKRPAVRKRVPLACEECRTRKRRCDGALPYCSGCKKRLSNCVYLADVQEKAWQHDMIRSLKSRLKELEGQAHPPDRGAEGDSTTVQDEIIVQDQPQENPAPLETGEAAAPNNSWHNNANDASTAPPVTSMPATSDVNASSGADQSLDPALAPAKPPSWTGSPYGGSSSGVSGRLEPIGVERLMRPIDQAIRVGTRIAASPLNRNAVTPTLQGCSCDRLFGVGAATWSLPLRRHADELVELYFHRVHLLEYHWSGYLDGTKYELVFECLRRLQEGATIVLSQSAGRGNASQRLLYKFLGQVLDREDDGIETSTGTYSDMQALLDLDTRIMEWRDKLPSHLQYEPTLANLQQDDASTPGSVSATGFSGQARRLYTRFLHVRVLILRPALEQFFQKQRHTPPNTQVRGSPRVARVQELILSAVAAQHL